MIKLLVCDVDGTLTDGSLYFGNDRFEMKAFSVKDGAVLKPLHQLGIEVIFLTGRKSEAVTRRAQDLQVTAIQNIADKATEIQKIFASRGVRPEETAYLGDDINDYGAMKQCGFKACPADAAAEIKAICDYVSPYPGGHGAARDICEKLLKDLGLWEKLLGIYL